MSVDGVFAVAVEIGTMMMTVTVTTLIKMMMMMIGKQSRTVTAMTMVW